MIDPHPLLEDLDESGGDEIVATIDGDRVVLTVDEIKEREGDVGGFVMIHAMDDGRRWWDLQADFTPQDGWSGFEAARRYQVKNETHWTSEVPVEAIERADLGVDPGELEPGQDFDYYDGETWRVVVPPAEREYDDKVLAYCLTGSLNGTKRLDPDRILRIGSLRSRD